MQDHLGIRSGRKEGSGILEALADLADIDQVAVMRQRQRPSAGREDDRLRVDQERRPRGGIAHVPHGRASGKPRQPLLVEDLRDVAHFPLDKDLAVLERGDAGGFLSPVLEGVETQVGEVRSVLGVTDPEDTAFVPESPGKLHPLRILTPVILLCCHSSTTAEVSMKTRL